jgi:hypothetical protein
VAPAVTARSAPVRLLSRDGRTMMEITSVDVAGGELLVKGCFTAAMPATTILRPEEVWKGLRLLGVRVLLAMPALLLVGWWRCRRSPSRTGGA